MPLKRGLPHCINHPAIPLVAERNLAVSRRSALNLLFRSNEVPFDVYVCPQCGYVEMYASEYAVNHDALSATADLSMPARRRRGESVLSALNFQSSVLEALQRGERPFRGAKITADISVEQGDRQHKIDAVVEVRNKIYVVEVKAAISESIVHDAIHEAMVKAQAYSETLGPHRRAKPMVIVPEGARVPAMTHRVPVIRFDQMLGKFRDRLLPLPSSTAG